MIKNFDTILTNLENVSLKNEDQEITLKTVCINVLSADFPEERIEAEEKFKRWLLAKKIYSGGEIDVTPEEIALIKKLLCDEVQDQSAIQWKIIEKLAGGTRRTVLAGDDDQSVHVWASADVERFVSQPGSVRVLNQSFRVPPEIQTLAFSVISMVHNRRPKTWAPRSGHGVIERIKSFNDADLSGTDILILARNTYILKEQIEPELRRSGIIYEKNGFRSIKENMLKAILDWEELRGGRQITVSSALNIYDYISSITGIKRGYKKLPEFENLEQLVDLQDLKNHGGLLVDDIWHESLDRIPNIEKSYLLAARKRGEKILGKPRVRISTIHSAKGSEAHTVILLKEMARKTYKEMQNDKENECRVYYVGITRAKEKLVIVESLNDRSFPWI